ncbi:hypothetical protein SUGI_0849340, partial [Cryptomeria japonica]
LCLFANETRPKAKGVVFIDVDGREQQAFLKDGKSEVIISVGALGSPQLLMLSGIGHAEELKPMGIKVIMDQPAVGKDETRPKAKGVVFIDVDGREQQAFLKDGKSEVIISAGALGSPQLLMLSEIGLAEELKPMGIKVIMDQPTVGK